MAFYLSPWVMYHRFIEADEENSNFYARHSYLTQTLQKSYEIYTLCTKQYAGFGTLLQFVPGTKANLARKQLSANLEPAIQSLKENIIDFQPAFIQYRFGGGGEFYWFKKYSYLLPLYSYLNVSPLFKLLEDIADGFKRSGIESNEKLPLIRVAFTFPILKDIFFVDRERQITLRDDALKNILHSILNPVRIIDDALSFLHRSAYRLLDIGSDRNANSSLPRALLKGVVGLLFGVIKLPVKVLKHTIDLPLNIVKSLVINPIAHFGNSIQEAYQNRDKKVLVTTKKELQDVKELRRAAKGREDTSYSKMTKPTEYMKEYIGITKEKLYSENDATTPERVVAIRASNEKITSTASLLSIVNLFSANQKIAKDEPEAIVAAKTVLSIF
jgi:hypothetical protein